MAKVRRARPKRSYRAVIESLRQVWKIENVPEDEAIWQLGEPEASTLPADHLRIAVWNLCKGAGGILFEHDYRVLCHRSDLILTQEALLSSRSLRTFCEPGFATVHAASYKRKDGLRDGVMTVSRAASVGTPLRLICKYPEPIFKTPKVALVKFYPMSNGEKLMVVNIHATLVRFVAGAVEEIAHLIARLPAHEGPILFAGDFNTFTNGYLNAVACELGRIGLSYVPIPNDPRPRGQALDQVFCRGLDIKSVVIDTTIRNSDHFPILLSVARRAD